MLICLSPSRLTNWLSKWYSNHDGKKKLQKPNPWAKNDDGSFYKAVLLSGPPGIGKSKVLIWAIGHKIDEVYALIDDFRFKTNK